jgi:hypothetical protein
MTTEERILKSASEGVSVREIAAEHGLSEEGVTAVLDRAAEVWFTGEHLRRELLLEVSRLSRLEEHYYNKALGDDEGSASAGASKGDAVRLECAIHEHGCDCASGDAQARDEHGKDTRRH